MTTAESPPLWSAGLILAVLAAVCTALVAFTHSVTAPRIEANRQAFLEQRLEPVLAGRNFDGKLSESTITIPSPHTLPGNNPVQVYRVFAGGEPVAALFVVTAPDGFSGPIELLVGIDASGVVTGVSVLSHRETPGLGDLIETEKSDWLTQFPGTSLTAPIPDNWAIKRDDGQFDQLTGASITPRAVVAAIKATLLYFESNTAQVFEQPAEEKSSR